MNMFLHEMDGARVEWCDTIGNPKLVEDDRLMRFDVVVANPPFSLDKWGADTAEHDKFKRFWRGVPPKSKGDFAFITHMIETARGSRGQGGRHRPSRRPVPRRYRRDHPQGLIEENLLEAVIGLPPNLFYGTGIPAAILLFNKGKTTTDVLFIDASRDFVDDKKQNRLSDQNIADIVAAFQAFASKPKYAHRATIEEIRENDFNLNIPRYVDTSEAEQDIDIAAVQAEIEELEADLRTTRAEIGQHLKELGLVK